MNNNVQHLYRSRHGIWYLRLVMPADIRTRFPELPKEVKRSLKTSQRRIAQPKAQRLLGEWLTAICRITPEHTMSNDQDRRLQGIFRQMKVPGLDEVPAQVDPAKAAPMVVEVDPVSNRITRIETHVHGLPEDVRAVNAALLKQLTHESPTRVDRDSPQGPFASTTDARPDAHARTERPSPGAMDIRPTQRPRVWLSKSIVDYIKLAHDQRVLSQNTIKFTHAPSLRLFRELISDKRRLFGEPDVAGIWDCRLDEITPDKLDAFIESFWSFPSRQGKLNRPGFFGMTKEVLGWK